MTTTTAEAAAHMSGSAGTVTVAASLLRDLAIAAEGAAESIEALRDGYTAWNEYDSWVEEARRAATVARAAIADASEGESATTAGIPAMLDTLAALVNVATELQGFGETGDEAVRRAANLLGIGEEEDVTGLKAAAAKQLNSQSRECARCGCDLDGKGHCTDLTCPFSECRQDDARGWGGHPEPPAPQIGTNQGSRK